MPCGGEGGVGGAGEEPDFGVGPCVAEGGEGGEGEDEIAEGTAAGGEDAAGRGHGSSSGRPHTSVKAGVLRAGGELRALRTDWARAETTGTATELPNWR